MTGEPRAICDIEDTHFMDHFNWTNRQPLRSILVHETLEDHSLANYNLMWACNIVEFGWFNVMCFVSFLLQHTAATIDSLHTWLHSNQTPCYNCLHCLGVKRILSALVSSRDIPVSEGCIVYILMNQLPGVPLIFFLAKGRDWAPEKIAYQQQVWLTTHLKTLFLTGKLREGGASTVARETICFGIGKARMLSLLLYILS